MLSIIQNSWDSVIKGHKNKVKDLEVKLESMARQISEFNKQVDKLKCSLTQQENRINHLTNQNSQIKEEKSSNFHI